MFYYETVLRNLNKGRVKYLVAGGMAINLYGIPRFTHDLDILVDFSKNNVLRLGKAMKVSGYFPKLPVKLDELSKPSVRERWIKKRNMKVFSFYNRKLPHQLVDVMILTKINFKRAYARKTVVASGNINIPLVSLKDLISLKEAATRKQDLGDLQMLRKILRIKQYEKE